MYFSRISLLLLLFVAFIVVLSIFSSYLFNQQSDQNLIDFLSYSDAVNSITEKYDENQTFLTDVVLDNSILKDSNNTKMISVGILVEKSNVVASFNTYGQLTLSNQFTTLTIKSNSKTVLGSGDTTFTLSVYPEFTYQSDIPDVLLPVEEIASALGYTTSEDDNGLTLSFPFQTKRLIIRSDKKIPEYGAVASADGYDNYLILQYSTVSDTINAYNKFLNSKDVESVQPDVLFFIESTDDTTESTTEPYATGESSYEYTSWGGADSQMRFSSYNQSLTTLYGSNLNTPIVAVLDSGIDSSHTAFTNRIASNGRNFTSSNTSNYTDDNSHGTHVSGIITDLTLPNVKILPLKVMNSKGEGTSSAVINAIEYAIQLKNNGANIVALNMSFGSESSVSNSVYKTVIEKAYSNNILSIVAAGNDNTSANQTDPAKVEKAITVAATDSAKRKASFSNYGSVIDVAAPGVQITAAIPGNNAYASYSGTSMAAPHVTALVASLYLIPNNGYTPASIEAIITENALDLGSTGKDTYFGYGLARLPLLSGGVVPDDPDSDQGTDNPDSTPTTQYRVTASAGTGGSITPNGTFMVDENSYLEFQFKPNSGYAVLSVTINGNTESYQSTLYIISKVTSNITISVKYQSVNTKISGYSRVTLTQTKGGDIVLNNGSPINIDSEETGEVFSTIVLVKDRTHLLLSFVPHEWYEVQEVWVDSINRTSTITNNTISQYVNRTDYTILCKFKLMYSSDPDEEEEEEDTESGEEILPQDPVEQNPNDDDNPSESPNDDPIDDNDDINDTPPTDETPGDNEEDDNSSDDPNTSDPIDDDDSDENQSPTDETPDDNEEDDNSSDNPNTSDPIDDDDSDENQSPTDETPDGNEDGDSSSPPISEDPAEDGDDGAENPSTGDDSTQKDNLVGGSNPGDSSNPIESQVGDDESSNDNSDSEFTSSNLVTIVALAGLIFIAVVTFVCFVVSRKYR
jgi:subtilisin family serine protease